MTALQATDLVKTYVGGDGGVLTVLDGVSLSVERGEMVAVVGASGAGKSTMLHVLGALDRPTRGSVFVEGTSLYAREDPQQLSGWRYGLRRARAAHVQRLYDDELSDLRNRKIGFVFQFHHLLREFSAIENVMMPMRVGGVAEHPARARATDLLNRVGLGARMDHRPAELSGGEQQRTAVARALAMEPAVLLADEPSGNLDHGNGERLHALLAALVHDLSIAMVVVTHNRALAMLANRVLLLEDGALRAAEATEVLA